MECGIFHQAGPRLRCKPALKQVVCHVFLSFQQMSVALLCLSSHPRAQDAEEMRTLFCHRTAGRAKRAKDLTFPDDALGPAAQQQ